MKTLTDLDQRVRHFEENFNGELPTFRQLFINCLGASRAVNAQEAIRAYALSRTLKEDLGGEPYNLNPFSLSDNDHALLVRKCAENQIGWAAYYHAQVLLKLQESEQEIKQIPLEVQP